MSEQIQIQWGKEFLLVELPPQWHLLRNLEPASLTGLMDMRIEVRKAMKSPVMAPALRYLISPYMKITFVIDDLSRPFSFDQILPEVLDEIISVGAIRSRITIIPASGHHLPMTESEVREQLGHILQPDIKCESHDCDDPARLTYLGTTSRGTPVWINKTVAESDLIISIGCVEAHILTGFSGGYDQIIPGLAGRATITHNLSISGKSDMINLAGLPVDQNLARIDLEEGAVMLGKQVFVINTVLDSHLKPVRIVTGDPFAAQRDGSRTCAETGSVLLEKPADVVITSSHTADADLWQSAAVLATAIRAVRPGGVLFILTRAEEGILNFGLAGKKMPSGINALKWLSPRLQREAIKLKTKYMDEEELFFLNFFLQAARHCRLVMYAPEIPHEIRNNLAFLHFVDSPEEGIMYIRQEYPDEASIAIIPDGGMTLANVY